MQCTVTLEVHKRMLATEMPFEQNRPITVREKLSEVWETTAAPPCRPLVTQFKYV